MHAVGDGSKMQRQLNFDFALNAPSSLDRLQQTGARGPLPFPGLSGMDRQFTSGNSSTTASNNWKYPAGLQGEGTVSHLPYYPLRANIADPSFSLVGDVAQQSASAGSSANHSVSLAPSELTNVQFTEDVQNEANAMFQKVYSQNTQAIVNELLARLKEYKKSPQLRDRQIAACVVKNLFEEYHFFKDYPEMELRTTAEIIGGFIRECILNDSGMAFAIFKIGEALHSSPGSALWTFGITSLNACRTAIHNFPKVCRMLASLPAYQFLPEPLKDYIKFGAQGRLPQHQSPEMVPWQSHSNGSSSAVEDSRRPQHTAANIFSTANVETLVSASETDRKDLKQPPEVVLGKVAFLFNNLTQTSLSDKAKEMQKLVEEQGTDFIKWLAQYIVIKRVSVEINFQPLYDSFLALIGNKQLDDFIVQETYRNIKILLRCDKKQAASNFSDRQLLKNLGSWLGKMTIAKERPIVISELDLKSLLLEGYTKGEPELLFVIPFVAKVVTTSGSSKIFHPNCAWIRAILRVLKELHGEETLKLNFKFEIELLFKNLNLEISQQITDGLLQNADVLSRLTQQLGIKATEAVTVKDTSSPASTQHSPVENDTSENMEQRINTPSGTKETVSEGSDNAVALTSREIVAAPMTPNFSYQDINVTSIDTLLPYVKVTAAIPVFQMSPQLMRIICSAMNLAIGKQVAYTTARSYKSAIEVARNLCTKDFAFDSDERHFSHALIALIYGLTSGMAYISSRELLNSSLQMHLCQGLKGVVGAANKLTEDQAITIERVSYGLADDNIEVATCFVVKTACEKAAQEVRKLIAGPERVEAMLRLDPTMLTLMQQIPEKLKAPASLKPEDFVVFNEFLSNLCGFKKSTGVEQAFSSDMSNGTKAGAVQQTEARPRGKKVEQFKSLIQTIVREIDAILNNSGVQTLRAGMALAVIREGLVQLAIKAEDQMLVVSFVRSLIEQLISAFKAEPLTMLKKPTDLATQIEAIWSKRMKYVFVNVCKALFVYLGQEELTQLISRFVCEATQKHKFNMDFIELLAEQGLFHIVMYDRQLAALIRAGDHEVITFVQNEMKKGQRGFALAAEQLMKIPFPNRPTSSLGSTSSNVTVSPVPTSTAANGVSNFPKPILPPTMPTRNTSAVKKEATVKNVRTENDASSCSVTVRGGIAVDVPICEKAEIILREWIQVCYSVEAQRQPEAALATIVRLMNKSNVITSDAAITEFFRACAVVCSDVAYRLLKGDTNPELATSIRQRCYYTLDSFSKLACLMVKCSSGSNAQTKISLLKKILDSIVEVLCADYKKFGKDFCPTPHHRMFTVMFNELTEPHAALDPVAWHIMEAFGQALSTLQPRHVPGFAFCWLDIVGHRNFMSRLLKGNVEPVKAAAMYTQLLVFHFKFLSPFLRNMKLPESVITLYKGTLRVLLVIFHDFPELFCEYYCVFCDAIPTHCIQLRNVILSAAPKNMRLPIPYTLNLEADDLPELSQDPKTQISMVNLIPSALLGKLENYFEMRSPADFLVVLPELLRNASQATNLPGLKYNSTLMNALVLYIGVEAIKAISKKQQTISLLTVADTSFMDVFESLSENLTNEGRYMLFNNMVDHLRYPCNRTYYFSYTILNLFLETRLDFVKEQIARTLYERLFARPPHPWGLQLTFTELAKNSIYHLWDCEFIHCDQVFEKFYQFVNAVRKTSASLLQKNDENGGLSTSCSAPTFISDPQD